MKLAFLVASAACASAVLAADADHWRSRSIYQLLTDRYALTGGSTTKPCITQDRKYCGGTYKGIINQLDYIQGMGFTAVSAILSRLSVIGGSADSTLLQIWISPVTRQIEGETGWGEAYHGYWQQDLYQLNPHFGSPDDLRELSHELHRRGMVCAVLLKHLATANKQD
jgi:alpha-amylase